MARGSKKENNPKVKTRKALKNNQLKDSFTNKFVTTKKSDTYMKSLSTSANHLSADEQMSQDPNTYDWPTGYLHQQKRRN